MKARYLSLLTSLVYSLAFLGFSASVAAHGCERHEDKSHKHCDSGPGPSGTAKYTAELILGDFEFASGEQPTPWIIKGLTANKKGTELPGNALLAMVPTEENANSVTTWADIFGDCALLVSGNGVVTGFGVLGDNWSIGYNKSRRNPNKLHITMRDLIILPGTSGSYSQVQFDLDLHGEFDASLPFLPKTAANPSVFELTEYKLWAGAAGQGGYTCNSDGRPPLLPSSWLRITLVE